MTDLTRIDPAGRTFFVLTGDIAGSTNIGAGKYGELTTPLKLLMDSWPEVMDGRIFRGDSFQLLFADAAAALRRALQLRCWFRKNTIGGRFLLDARIAIGAGKVDYFGKTVLDSDGEAFRLSAQALDAMKAGDFLAVVTRDEALNEQLRVIFLLMEGFISKWTRNKAEVIFGVLANETQQAMANDLGVGQSAIHNRLKLARWKKVEKTLAFMARRLSADSSIDE